MNSTENFLKILVETPVEIRRIKPVMLWEKLFEELLKINHEKSPENFRRNHAKTLYNFSIVMNHTNDTGYTITDPILVAVVYVPNT